jgi:hypothetical protein
VAVPKTEVLEQPLSIFLRLSIILRIFKFCKVFSIILLTQAVPKIEALKQALDTK